jgi:hypothetical protein
MTSPLKSASILPTLSAIAQRSDSDNLCGERDARPAATKYR